MKKINLSKEDKEKLISLAKNSILEEFDSKKDSDTIDKFSQKRGVFVTLKKKGELRGCIGIVKPIFTLKKAIKKAAKSAAFNDPVLLSGMLYVF